MRTLPLLASLILIISINAVHAAPIEDWAEYSLPPGASAPASITFGNGIFVAVGGNGTIITSPNGADWTKVTSPTSANLGRVRFVNGRFFTLNPFMVSTNGADWWPAPAPADAIRDITFANGAYYSVGYTAPGLF